MSLKGLEEKIYKREEKPENQKRGSFLARELPGSNKSGTIEPAFFKAQSEDKSEIWLKEEEEKKIKNKKIKKIAIISGITLAALVLIIGGVVYFRKKAFTEDKVSVSISGPSSTESGDLTTIDIDYKNDNWADLKNVVLYINYSENFKLEDNLSLQANGPNASQYNIGTLKGRTSGRFEIKGKFFGTKDLLTYIEAKLSYSSSTFSSTFQAENKLATMITSSPLTIEVSGPQTVYSGGAVTYIINFKNTGGEIFKGMMIKSDYPEGFIFSSSEPLAASEKNAWYVGDIAAGTTGSVKIIGSLSGAVDEIKRFKMYIGTGSGDDFSAYNSNEISTKIIGSPLLVKQTVNDKSDEIMVNANNVLVFKINYQNTGSTPLRDVILTETIKSPILDYAKFSTTGAKGGLDSKTGKITWTGAQVEGLKVLTPGAGGQIIFTIPVKEKIDVKSVSDKNFSILAVASMDSPDIPTPEGANKQIASNAVNIKLNSKLLMTLKGYFNDADIQNTGPLPLKVGQETTFTMHLEIGNISNDITDAQVVMNLAPGVKWKNNYLSKNESVSYNDRNNILTWNIGSLPAGIGILTDPKSLVFQIGVNPSQTQVGNYASLINSTTFSASDVFTKQNLTLKLDEKNSSLTEDISVGDMGKVEQ
jgi:hypothetical protein